MREFNSKPGSGVLTRIDERLTQLLPTLDEKKTQRVESMDSWFGEHAQGRFWFSVYLLWCLNHVGEMGKPELPRHCDSGWVAMRGRVLPCNLHAGGAYRKWRQGCFNPGHRCHEGCER